MFNSAVKGCGRLLAAYQIAFGLTRAWQHILHISAICSHLMNRFRRDASPLLPASACASASALYRGRALSCPPAPRPMHKILYRVQLSKWKITAALKPLLKSRNNKRRATTRDVNSRVLGWREAMRRAAIQFSTILGQFFSVICKSAALPSTTFSLRYWVICLKMIGFTNRISIILLVRLL